MNYSLRDVNAIANVVKYKQITTSLLFHSRLSADVNAIANVVKYKQITTCEVGELAAVGM